MCEVGADRRQGDAHHRDVERVEEERAAEHEQGAPGEPGQLVGAAERSLTVVLRWWTRIELLCAIVRSSTVHELFDGCQTMIDIDMDGPASDEPARSRRDAEAPDLETIDGMTVLQALSDPVRLEIVRQLAGCVGRGAS